MSCTNNISNWPVLYQILQFFPFSSFSSHLFVGFWICVSGPAIGGEDLHFRTMPDSYPWSGLAKFKVHCGSAFEPGASGPPYYCTPPVCVPDVIGALACGGKTTKKNKGMRGRNNDNSNTSHQSWNIKYLFFSSSIWHLGSLTAANWVSFDFNVSYSSCWGYSLMNTLKLKKNWLHVYAFAF